MALDNDKNHTAEKIGSILRRQLRKSKDFDLKVQGCCEVYYVDGMDISFNVISPELEAIYKSGAKFVSMDCAYDGQSSVQKARFNMFHDVLGVARKRNDKEKAKKAQLKALAAGQIQAVKEMQNQQIQNETSKIK